MHYKIANAYIKMLKDTSCTIQQILTEEIYLRLYYPMDDAIRNKGDLTLLYPLHIDNMSQLLLFLTTHTIDEILGNKVNAIPNKSTVIQIMKHKTTNEGNQVLDTICATMENRAQNRIMKRADRINLLWEVASRLLNAKIG